MASDLYARLTAIAPLPGGWHPLRIPDGAALPAGVYQRISGVPYATTHGGGTDLKSRRFQLTVYSERYEEGRVAAATVAAALNGTRSAWASGEDVSAMLADEAEDVDPDPRGLFRQRVDVMLGSEAA